MAVGDSVVGSPVWEMMAVGVVEQMAATEKARVRAAA